MNADQLTQFVEQVHGLWETHVPAQYQVSVVPVAVGLLLLGIGLSVLGAKLARAGITCGLGVAGALLALALAPLIDVPTIVVVLIGTFVAGGMGYGLFRLWVGLAVAACFSAVAIGAYGSRAVVPHFTEYQSVQDFDGTFTLPEAPQTSDSESARDALADIRVWADDFWLYVQSQQVDVNRRILLVGVGSALLGLLLGALLPRLTLIVTTSVVGTMMVMSGLAGLAARFQADFSQAVGQHERVVATAGIVFLLASLLLQTLLTRKVPVPAPVRPQPGK